MRRCSRSPCSRISTGTGRIANGSWRGSRPANSSPTSSYNKNLIALGDREPNVSAGGNDIVVDETDEGTYVLFLTSRGLKHYFTGFLHVPSGGDPKKFFEFEDKPPSQLVRYDKDWYFVAN